MKSILIFTRLPDHILGHLQFVANLNGIYKAMVTTDMCSKSPSGRVNIWDYMKTYTFNIFASFNILCFFTAIVILFLLFYTSVLTFLSLISLILSSFYHYHLSLPFISFISLCRVTHYFIVNYHHYNYY